MSSRNGWLARRVGRENIPPPLVISGTIMTQELTRNNEPNELDYQNVLYSSSPLLHSTHSCPNTACIPAQGNDR